MILKKDPPWNVLVFPASSEVGLEIHRALSACKEVVLHGACQPGPSVGAYHFERLHEVPSIYDAACLSALQKLVRDCRIDAIFPAYDDVVVWLAEHADKIPAAILAPSVAACQTCRSKSQTYETLYASLPVPRIWAPGDAGIKFPVFVKPDKGQGSQRARRLDTLDELQHALAAEPDLIVLEYLPGDEYTVDCFSTRDGKVLFAGSRRRLQMKSGIATITQAEKLPFAEKWAEVITKKIGLYGAWFYQVRAGRDAEFKLLEIGPRVAGSMALHRVLGPNFPLLTLYEAAGYPLHIDVVDVPVTMGRSLDIQFHHNIVMAELYIDLDDTLILRGKVNTDLVALIYQCRNKGIPVHVITRHANNALVTLEKHRLNGIFDRVIHITDRKAVKSQFISNKNSVLIDDSYAERHEAALTGRIICFDAAAAVCLLDNRR